MIATFAVTEFILRSSFLFTITVVELHGLLDGSSIQAVSILCASLFIASCIFGFHGI